MDQTTNNMNNLKIEDGGSDRKILIAVDFGTTFSGVAWAQTRRVSEIIPGVIVRLLLLKADRLQARCTNHYHPMARCYVWRIGRCE